MHQDLVVAGCNDAAGLVSAAMLKLAVNCCDRPCHSLIVKNPLDHQLPLILQAGEVQSHASTAFRLHLLVWESPATSDERAMLFRALGAHRVATLIASSSEQARWSDAIPAAELSRAGVRMSGTLVEGFPELAAAGPSVRRFLQIADDIRAGNHRSKLAQMAQAAAAADSPRAANDFFHHIVGTIAIEMPAVNIKEDPRA